MSTSTQVASFDWFGTHIGGDPYADWSEWREDYPVWWTPDLHGYVVSRHSDVRQVLTDHRRFAQSTFFEGALEDAFGTPTVVNLNPPEHGHIRRSVNEHYRPASVMKRLGTDVRKAISDLVDSWPPTGVVVLDDDFSRPLVMKVMSAFFGTSDIASVAELYARTMAYLKSARTASAGESVQQEGRDAGRQLMAFLGDLYDKADGSGTQESSTTVLESIARSGIERDQALAMCAITLIGGVETTIRGISNSVYALLRNPAAMAAIRTNPKLSKVAFDEALRWISPVSFKARETSCEVEFHGVTMPEGARVFAAIGAANRDPDKYPEPDQFMLQRGTTDHLAFGAGPHYCIGSALSRLEGEEALGAFSQRFRDLEFDDEWDEYFDGPIYRAPVGMRIRYRK